MTKTTDEQLFKLWRASSPLSKAWHTFARAEDRHKWKALAEASAIDAFAKGIEAAPESDDDGFAKLQKVLSDPQRILAERTAHRSRLQSDLLRYIQNGHLYGYGFETPRTLNSVPVAIPKRAWAGRIEWDKNTLTFESIKLVEVRLTTNRIRNEILERGTVDTTPTQPPGRPGVKQAIEDAFHALSSAGKIDPEKSARSHFPQLMDWLDKNRPDLEVPPAKMSPKTIYKHFSPLFKDLQKRKNL